jgi:uncharacterized membrane protein
MHSKHNPSAEKHPKQDFQVERIAFFSDAVFAIALTLLVIEFRPPHIEKEATGTAIWHQLVEMKYLFVSVVFSFILIINYWVRHHTLFKHIHNYNKQIIVANMATLFPIVFFPFTTSFFYEGSKGGDETFTIPFQLFLVNNILAGATMYYFYWIVMKKYKTMSYPMPKEETVEFERRLLIMAVSFMLVLLISFISFKASFWGLIPFALYNLYERYFKKKQLNKTGAK